MKTELLLKEIELNKTMMNGLADAFSVVKQRTEGKLPQATSCPFETRIYEGEKPMYQSNSVTLEGTSSMGCKIFLSVSLSSHFIFSLLNNINNKHESDHSIENIDILVFTRSLINQLITYSQRESQLHEFAVA